MDKIASLSEERIKQASKIRQMFADISARYDFLNHLLSFGLHRRWRREAAAEAEVSPDGLILDLCTGTGDLALVYSRRFPNAKILAIDFCLEMLLRAKRKLEELNSAPSISLLCGDGLHLPLEDESCDLVAAAFGIRNFVDLKAGFEEIYRCLKVGGRAVFLEFSTPNLGIFNKPFYLYFNRIVPFLGEYISRTKGSYSYLWNSVREFPSPDELKKLMEEIGFRQLRCRLLSGGIVALYYGLKNGTGSSS